MFPSPACYRRCYFERDCLCLSGLNAWHPPDPRLHTFAATMDHRQSEYNHEQAVGCVPEEVATRDAATPPAADKFSPAGADDVGVEPVTGVARSTGAVTCRVCFVGAGAESLCTPCPCRGSMRFVHPSCLRTEFLAKRNWTQLTCSVCKNEFTGPQALELARVALEWSESDWGPDEVGTLIAADHLGRLLTSAGELRDAEPLLRRALAGLERALGPSDPETLIAASNLGILLASQGAPIDAEQLVRRAWTGSTTAKGEDHPDTLVLGMNLAVVLRDLEKPCEAEPLLRRALEGLGKRNGEQHPDALAAAGNLGSLLLHLRSDLGEAEPLLRRAWEGSLRHFGPEHPRSVQAAAELGLVLLERSRPTEAESLLRSVAAVLSQNFGQGHPRTLSANADHGSALYAMGRKLEAERPLRIAWEGRREALGPGHLRTLASAHNLGVLLADLRRRDDALSLLWAAFKGRRDKLGLTHSRTVASASRLASLLQNSRDHQAAPVFRCVWEGLTRQLGASHPKTIAAARGLARWLARWGFKTEAEAVLLRAIAHAQEISTGEEDAGKVTMLREALLEPKFDAVGWRMLLADAACRPAAADLLAADLQTLHDGIDRLAVDFREGESGVEGEEKVAKRRRQR